MRFPRTLLICSLVSLVPAAAQAQVKPPATQVVDIKAGGNVTLKASYLPAGRPGPAILMLHACNKDRKSWTGLATAAAAQGFHVLALDFRGFGESGGPRFTTGAEQQSTVDLYWPGDVDAALAWLTSQPQVDKTRIGAVGASCGVNEAVQLARRHPEVRTVVMLSGGVNAAGRLHLRDSPGLPLLAAASHGDGGAVGQMQWALGWSRNPANKLVEYKAAGHGTDMFAVEKGLEPLVLSWFTTHLRNAPAKPAAVVASKPSAIEEFWTTLSAPGGVAKARQIYDQSKRGPGRPDLLPGDRHQPARLSAPAGRQPEGRRRGLQAQCRSLPRVGEYLRQPVGCLPGARQSRRGPSLCGEGDRDDSEGRGGDGRLQEARSRERRNEDQAAKK